MGLKGYRLWVWVNLIQPAEPHRISSHTGHEVPSPSHTPHASNTPV
jgi:hypothetical protein